jgi:hypothetical protein
MTVLEKLQTVQPLQAPPSALLPSLNLLLLQSDPLDGTELREANVLCIAKIEKAKELLSPVKRYISPLTQASEAMCSKITTLRKENVKQRELLQTRKKRNTSKRVALKGKFVFSTQEVLEIAREAEKATKEKTTRKR